MTWTTGVTTGAEMANEFNQAQTDIQDNTDAIATKEGDLGLGTANQVLATNAAADGKEWVDLEAQTEYATNAEVIAGNVADKAVSPLTAAAVTAPIKTTQDAELLKVSALVDYVSAEGWQVEGGSISNGGSRRLDSNAVTFRRVGDLGAVEEYTYPSSTDFSYTVVTSQGLATASTALDGSDLSVTQDQYQISWGFEDAQDGVMVSIVTEDVADTDEAVMVEIYRNPITGDWYLLMPQFVESSSTTAVYLSPARPIVRPSLLDDCVLIGRAIAREDTSYWSFVINDTGSSATGSEAVEMSAATSGLAGVGGLTPNSLAGDQDKVLSAGATWVRNGLRYSPVADGAGLIAITSPNEYAKCMTQDSGNEYVFKLLADVSAGELADANNLSATDTTGVWILQKPTTDLMPYDPSGAWDDGDIAVYDDTTSTFVPLVPVIVSGTDVTDTLVGDTTTTETYTVSTTTSPASGSFTINPNYCQYIQIGKRRDYKVRFYLDTDDALVFNVTGATDVALVIGSGYPTLGVSPYMRAGRYERTGVNRIHVERNSDNNADMWVDLNFTAIMS